MHGLTSLVTLAFVAPLALAAPAPLPKVDVGASRSFTIPRVRNHNHVRNGKKAMRKAYEKFGFPIIVFGGGEGQNINDDTDSTSTSTSSGLSGDGESLPWSFGSGSGSWGGWGHNSGSDSGSSVAAIPSATALPSSVAASIVAPAPSSSAPASTVAAAPSSANDASSATASAAAGGAAASGSGKVTGEANASPAEGGAEYLVPVTIGGQTLNLDFDTGSADLWVYGPQAGGSGRTNFDSSKSTTFKAISGASFEISYGDGSSASGTVGTDKVSVGKATVTSQAVEIATQVSSEFSKDTENDGLLGLAFSTINSVQPRQQKTFFSNIQSQLAQPLFTVTLDSADSDGEYEFGTIDSSKYNGSINYTPVDSGSGFWEFTSTSYKVGGTVGQNSNASPTIADTGTSLMLVDDAVLEAYYGQVSGAQNSKTQGGYVYPCSAKLPDFGVAIGDTGYYATIPGSEITYQKLGGGQCFGGIQSNAGQRLQIYGDVFLRSQFTVFDGGNTRIGFAARP